MLPIEIVGFSRPLNRDTLQPGDIFVSARYDQHTLFMRLALPGGSFALAIGDLFTGEVGVYVTHMDNLEGPIISAPGNVVIRPSRYQLQTWPVSKVERNTLIVFATGEACLTAMVGDTLKAISLDNGQAINFEAVPGGYTAFASWSAVLLPDNRLLRAGRISSSEPPVP